MVDGQIEGQAKQDIEGDLLLRRINDNDVRS